MRYMPYAYNVLHNELHDKGTPLYTINKWFYIFVISVYTFSREYWKGATVFQTSTYDNVTIHYRKPCRTILRGGMSTYKKNVDLL